jgi:hypothetical protein
MQIVRVVYASKSPSEGSVCVLALRIGAFLSRWGLSLEVLCLAVSLSSAEGTRCEVLDVYRLCIDCVVIA